MDEILNSLQAHLETPLESVLSSSENELVQRYGQELISWFEGIRGHLIEILGRTSVLLADTEERNKKKKDAQELLDQMATLRMTLKTSSNNLDDVLERRNPGKSRMEPGMPKDVDDDQPAIQTGNVAAQALDPVSDLTGLIFSTLLEDTRTNLQGFHSSRHTFKSNADILHHQAFQCTPHCRPIIPVRNVEIEPNNLDPTLRQIIVEEFELLYSHFFSSLTEEIGKRGEATKSNLAKATEDANKLVWKLFASGLGCDDVLDLLVDLLNGRQDYSPESDAISSVI